MRKNSVELITLFFEHCFVRLFFGRNVFLIEVKNNQPHLTSTKKAMILRSHLTGQAHTQMLINSLLYLTIGNTY